MRAKTRIVGRQHIGRRTFRCCLQDGALALLVEIAQQLHARVGGVTQRDQQARDFVVVVVAQRPLEATCDWRILAIPGTRCFTRPQGALQGFGAAAITERFVQPADTIVRRGNKHQVARRPGVKIAVRVHTGHSQTLHLIDVVPTDHLPFVGDDGIEPCIVRAIANRVVIQKRA